MFVWWLVLHPSGQENRPRRVVLLLMVVLSGWSLLCLSSYVWYLHLHQCLAVLFSNMSRMLHRTILAVGGGKSGTGTAAVFYAIWEFCIMFISSAAIGVVFALASALVSTSVCRLAVCLV